MITMDDGEYRERWERWRQPRLSDIVGQPCIRTLQAFVADPTSRCFLFEGEPGIGKSATAHALAHELGADDNSWGGGYYRTWSASELTIDVCRTIFQETLRLRFNNWKVVVFEELDGVASKQVERYLKVHLEHLPPQSLVIATSNGAGRLDPALMERFRFLRYSSGKGLQIACQQRLAAIWKFETDGADLPAGWKRWGVMPDRFSMRKALESLHEALQLWRLDN